MPLSVIITKRLIDIFISSLVLVLFSPMLALIALAIKVESPGPWFYKQRRVLRGGGCHPQEFEIYKFRTMVQDAEANSGAVNASTNDPRVTKVGKFLRPTRLDEIPNLINVLRGEMSVVGPRADRLDIFKEINNEFPTVWDRMKYVKPGITGSAQIHLMSDGSLTNDKRFISALPDSDIGKPVKSFRYKLYHDFAYTLKLSSFWSFIKTDFMIMLKTPIVMFIRRNTI